MIFKEGAIMQGRAEVEIDNTPIQWYPSPEGVRTMRGLLWGLLLSLPFWFVLWLTARWIWRMI